MRRATLADIYNWFVEGFDITDLKDAKALFKELGRARFSASPLPDRADQTGGADVLLAVISGAS
jgi:hypothetical protein